MITVRNKINSCLKGIIYYKDEAIGECDCVETFLDILCQIKKEQSDDYSMRVEVETSNNSKRTYVYHFTKNGKVVPSSYPGVYLWTDMMNKDLLYLYNFSVNNDFTI
jgi:hypothetical protein